MKQGAGRVLAAEPLTPGHPGLSGRPSAFWEAKILTSLQSSLVHWSGGSVHPPLLANPGLFPSQSRALTLLCLLIPKRQALVWGCVCVGELFGLRLGFSHPGRRSADLKMPLCQELLPPASEIHNPPQSEGHPPGAGEILVLGLRGTSRGHVLGGTEGRQRVSRHSGKVGSLIRGIQKGTPARPGGGARSPNPLRAPGSSLPDTLGHHCEAPGNGARGSVSCPSPGP